MPAFVKAKKFKGRKPGYVFKNDGKGTSGTTSMSTAPTRRPRERRMAVVVRRRKPRRRGEPVRATTRKWRREARPRRPA